MKPEAQRIAIAEACGIHVCQSCNHQIDPDVCWCGDSMDHGHEGHSAIPSGCTCGFSDAEKRRLPVLNIPDYLNDLNAMHEAEKTLIASGVYKSYWRELISVTTCDEFFLIHASAAQRAEAFLRAINLWEE